VEQGEQKPGLDIILKFVSFLTGQGSFLVALGQCAHPRLVLFLEPDGQDVATQFARQITVVGLDEPREDRNLASSVVLGLAARRHDGCPHRPSPDYHIQTLFYAQTLRSSDLYPTASAMWNGSMSLLPATSLIVRATPST
jgi:hypothetical protein